MNVKVFATTNEVIDRLAELGLTQAGLLEVVQRGHTARLGCTPNHPPLTPGIMAWAETVCALRETLRADGWTRCDDGNWPLTINPKADIALSVATGNEATGRAGGSPTTKSSKGPRTEEAVVSNALQLNLFEQAQDIPDALDQGADRTTWFLLIHFDHFEQELRSELARPITMNREKKVDGWAERIILPTIPLDGSDITIPASGEPDGGSDIEVEVRRRG
jgi:hypothetical protein